MARDFNTIITRADIPPEGKTSDITLILKLLTYIKPHLLWLVLGTIFLLLSLALDLLRPLILKETIDSAFPQKDMQIVWQYAIIYSLVIMANLCTRFIQNYMLQLFGQRIIYDIRTNIFNKIINQNTARFQETTIGNLVTRVTNDTESLRTLYTDVLLKLFSSTFMIVGILIFMYYLNVKLAIVVTSLLPFIGALIFIYQKYSRKAFRAVRTKLAASNSSVQEMLNFIIIVKTYVGEQIMAKSYDKVSKEFLEAGLYEVKTFAIFRPLVDALFFVTIITIFSFTNWFDSVIEAGTIFAFLQYMDKFFQPLKEIAEKYNSLQSSLAGAERIIPLLEEENHIIEEITIPEVFKTIKSITFDHVWFSYTNSEEYAIKDISFNVKQGEFIGVAGASGSGKSTLMSLLMGFYKPSKGRILINDIDIAEYSPRLIRELIGYVFQDSHLFKGTIRENLTMYDSAISEETIISATKKVHLHEMINKLPNGYDTAVGYLGSLLSSGQKQLLALARVLIKSRKVLIFDEATANIDSQTESFIEDSIEQIRGEKTIISIAHRLSTIRKADRILFIEGGRIAESGTYHELVHKKGKFYEMWKE